MKSMKKKESCAAEEPRVSELDLQMLFSPDFLGVLEILEKDTPASRQALLVAQGALLFIAKKIAPATGLPLTIVKEGNTITICRNLPLAGMEALPLTPGQSGNA